MKTLDDYFADWESYVFGFGYGTGEEHILPSLKSFLECCNDDAPYDFQVLEAKLTPTVAWLLINILCRHNVDIIEYGTSPRCGWLTPHGIKLKEFVATKTVDELIGMTGRDSEYTPCFPDYCNCDVQCNNPFWGVKAGKG